MARATKHLLSSLVALAALAGAAPGHAQPKPAILTELPAKGSVPFGKIVLLDDGKCPAGEIKEIRGGDQKQGIARQVRCIKRTE